MSSIPPVSKSYILLPGGGRLTVVGMIMLAVFAVGDPAGASHPVRLERLCPWRVRNLGRADGGAGRAHDDPIYTLSSFLAGLAGIVFSLYTSAGYSLNAAGRRT